VSGTSATSARTTTVCRRASDGTSL
jgi:hypothetical protein